MSAPGTPVASDSIASGSDSSGSGALVAVVDVAVVSVFGRGNWLASELARRGAKVTLLDATDALIEALLKQEGVGSVQSGAPEQRPEQSPEQSPATSTNPSYDHFYLDAEGPFGCFETPFLLDSQKQRLFDDGDVSAPTAQVTPRGACFWTAFGPLEGRSEITSYRLKAMGLAGEAERYLRWAEFDSVAAAATGKPLARTALERTSARLRGRLARLPFREVWLAAFAHQAASVVYFDSVDALAAGTSLPVPLLSPFWLRRPTAAGAKRALAICARQGVAVTEVAALWLRLNQRIAHALSVAVRSDGTDSAHPAEVRECRAHAFVWCLTAAESQLIAPEASALLFPDGPATADWRWARAVIALGEAAPVTSLPPWTAVVGDECLPWLDDNFFVLRQRPHEVDHVDVWARLSSERVAQDGAYVARTFARVARLLADRLPGAAPRVVRLPSDFPSESMSPLRAARAPMQPVFSPESLGRVSRLRSPNLFFDGPETWETLDWNGAFARQAETVDRLVAMQAVREAVAAKLAARAARVADRAARRLAKGQSAKELAKKNPPDSETHV